MRHNLTFTLLEKTLNDALPKAHEIAKEYFGPERYYHLDMAANQSGGVTNNLGKIVLYEITVYAVTEEF